MLIDVQALYEALARILEEREQVKIKVIVREENEKND